MKQPSPLANSASKTTVNGNDVTSRTRKDPTQPVEVTETSHQGQVAVRNVKKDGKVVQTAGSQDAQESGVFEDVSKKAGDKNPQLTNPSMNATKASEEAKKVQGKDMDKGPLKEELQKGEFHRKTGIRHLRRLIKPKANGALPNPVKVNPLEKADQEPDHDPKAKKGTPENPVILNYKEMNKPKAQPSQNSLDYKKLGTPPPAPKRWETNQAVKLQDKRKQQLAQFTKNYPSSELVHTEKPVGQKNALTSIKEKQIVAPKPPTEPKTPAAPKPPMAPKIEKSENAHHSNLVGIVGHVEHLLGAQNLSPEAHSKIEAALKTLSEITGKK